MLGYLSHETGEDIDSLDLTGFGITFVAYTQGLASFPKGLVSAPISLTRKTRKTDTLFSLLPISLCARPSSAR